MTFLAILSLMIYFSVMLSTAINHSKYNLINSRFIRDLYVDEEEYVFPLSAFDFAVQLSYTGTQANVTNLFQYFSIKMYEYSGKLKDNYLPGEYPIIHTVTDMGIVRCDYDRLGGDTKDDPTRWWCPNVT